MTREREITEERPRAAGWAERATVPERRRPAGRRLVGSAIGFVAIATLAGIVAFRSSPTARLAATLPSVEARLLRLGVPTSPAAIVPSVAPERDATAAMTKLGELGRTRLQRPLWTLDLDRILGRGILEARILATADEAIRGSEMAAPRNYADGQSSEFPELWHMNEPIRVTEADLARATREGDAEGVERGLTRLDRIGAILQTDVIPWAWTNGFHRRSDATLAAVNALKADDGPAMRAAIRRWRDARPPEPSPVRGLRGDAALYRQSLSNATWGTDVHSRFSKMSAPRLPLIGPATMRDAWCAAGLSRIADHLEKMDRATDPAVRRSLLVDYLRRPMVGPATDAERYLFEFSGDHGIRLEKTLREEESRQRRLTEALGK